MKTQMIIGGILFGVAACTAPADGYRITGNIEGAGDGKAILLQSAGFGEPTMGDTVNMRNGKFVFEGRLESPVSVTVKVCPDSDQPASLGFIAENSPIRVMAAWKDVIERYGYRSIGGQTVEGSLNQEVYEKIAGVYGQILKAPEHKEYAEAQQKMAGLRNTDTEAYYKLQDETEPLSERFSEAVRQRQLELIRENRTVESSVLNLRMMWNDMTLEELKDFPFWILKCRIVLWRQRCARRLLSASGYGRGNRLPIFRWRRRTEAGWLCRICGVNTCCWIFGLRGVGLAGDCCRQ